MTLELTREQIVALDMALKTRIRSIEGLIHRWENDTINENTTYLIETYGKELAIVSELESILNK